MRWRGRRQSSKVEDRRHMGRGMAVAGGGLGTLILLALVLLFGGDPAALLQQAPPQGPGRFGGAASPEEEQLREFAATVLADTEDVWNRLFADLGQDYREPTMVLFSDQVHSACGIAGAAVGPFYCPADEKIYLDLTFFQELHDRFGAPGDFAQAYVIAHEVAHHVQKLLGTSDRVARLRRRATEKEANQLSVRLELQADFLAGVWAHHAQRTKHILEEGDIEEALAAASAIGDDRLQMQARGYVTPDSFTHGTSAQRVEWFRRGFLTGDLRQADTLRDLGP